MTGRRTYHAHGCRQCRTRYQDNCEQHGEDDLCPKCSGLAPSQLLIDNAAPHDCCYARSRLATKDERKTYHLAGRSNWFLCIACGRTHPTRPIRKEDA